MTALFNRAIWDVSGAGAIDARHPAFKHPEAMRGWSRRPVHCPMSVVTEIEGRVELLTENILQSLGYKQGDITAPEPKISLTAFNKMGGVSVDPSKPRLHARKARFLVRIAATLHASDKMCAEVKYGVLRDYLTCLLAVLEGQGDAGALAAFALDPDLTGLAYKLIAVSSFESKCQAEDIPYAAMSDLFAWDPFEAMPDSDVMQLRHLHDRALDIEQESAAGIVGLENAISEGDFSKQGNYGWAEAVRAALAAMPSVDCNGKPASGSSFHHRIRLAWDCLQIWLEVWPDRWPSNTWGASPFLTFVAAVYEVATGIHPDDLHGDETETNVDGIDKELRNPIRKGECAFLAQEQLSVDELPFVAVGDPFAEDGRFLTYLVNPNVGPAGYVERWKTNKSLKRSR